MTTAGPDPSAAHDASGPRIRLDVAYDGTAFSGWARQPETRTVCGVLEAAIAPLTRRHGPEPQLTVAGRTDAGVHALGQVAHFDLTEAQADALLGRARRRGAADPDLGTVLASRINGVLGAASDVVVRRASIAPAGFDARFAALWRRYEYRIADARAERDPLHRLNTPALPLALDVGSMNDVAARLLGLHDFATFCRPSPTGTTIRTLQEFTWRRADDGVLVAIVQADAFCHSMVRALVGACVAVGAEKLSPGDGTRLLDARVRTSEFTVMPAKGLTLLEVGYPPDAELAARATLTRGLRSLDDATSLTDRSARQ